MSHDLVVRGDGVRRRRGRRASSRRSAPELGGRRGAEIDARGRLVLPGRGRRPRAPQRPRAGRLGGLRHRHARPGRRRRDLLRRHAAQTPCRRPSTRPPSTPRWPRPAGAPGSTSRCGAAWCRATLDRMDELAERGVVGFKAFMCPSGVDEFPAADAEVLGRGMERAARLGLPVAVHAEDPALDRAAGRPGAWPRGAPACATGPPRGRSRPSWRPSDGPSRWPARPAARCTWCTSRAPRRSTWSPRPGPRGVDVTCEACPHHLVLDEDDAAALGAVAKCAPPLRSACRAGGARGGGSRRARWTWWRRTTRRDRRS